MNRKGIITALALLLVMMLAMPVQAFGGGWGEWGESDSGSSDPKIGEGHQKTFGESATEATEETEIETYLETTDYATEETTYPETSAEESTEAVMETGYEEQPEESGWKPVPETVEEPSGDGESFTERLFFRKVTHTEKWKLIVPAVGAAVSLAVLFMSKKQKTGKNTHSAVEHTSMSAWDDLDRGE